MTKSRNIRDTSSRAFAKANGLTYYVSSKPCKRGHTTQRLTSNGSCLACMELVKAEKDRKYYERHSDRVKNNVKRYRVENAEVVKARNKEKWFRNHEANLAKCKVRSARHTEKRRLNREYDAFLARVDSEDVSA